MSILTIIITLLVVGVLLYLVNLIPMEPTIKRILNITVIILAVVWLLKAVGFWHYLLNMTV